MGDVTIGLAFLAGLISFISPCVLPLVPAYIGYMGGQATQQAQRQSSNLRQRFGTLTHGLFFVLGFTIFFVLFGLLTTAAVSSLTAIGATESDVEHAIARVGGLAVILFGLHVMGVLNRVFTWLLNRTSKFDQNPYANVISTFVGLALLGLIYWMFAESWFMTLVVFLVLLQVFHDAFKADTPGEFWTRAIVRVQSALYMDTRRQNRPESKYGYLGSMFMGVVFSAGWTPCIGPIYAAVLTMANSGEKSLLTVASLMTAYSLGLGVPFLLTALALNQSQGLFRRLQKNMRTIEAFSGIFLLIVGVLVFTGQLQKISTVGSQGNLGKISYDMEECVTAAAQKRIELGFSSIRSCIADGGTKNDLYVAVARGPRAEPITDLTPSIEAPSLNDQSISVPSLDTPPNQNVEIGLDVGQRAPNFTAETIDGETVSLEDYRGQVVLLNLWATWCGPCLEEMPMFQTAYDTYGPDDFTVLALNATTLEVSRDDVDHFVDDLNPTFPVLLDPNGHLTADVYPIRVGLPNTYLIDENGIIVEVYNGVVEGNDLFPKLDQLTE
jgi:cytochrome c-type biogenesis protein